MSSDFANVLVGDVIPTYCRRRSLIIVLAVAGVALPEAAPLWARPLRDRQRRRGRRPTASMCAVPAPFLHDRRRVLRRAGLFITANAGSGDPLIGAGYLLKVFTAVVLGGTMISGGRGGAVGTVFGALTLTIIVDIFLVLGVRSFYVPIVEGAILLFAVLGLGTGAQFPNLAGFGSIGQAARQARSFRRSGKSRRYKGGVISSSVLPPVRWLARTLRSVLPGYVILIVVLGTTAAINGANFHFGTYLVSLLTFGSFLAILGLGQGAVITAGGLDLSVPWTITFPAIVVTTFANNSDAAAIWAIPLGLAVGALIGLFNGALVAWVRISPIIATLATGSILEGAASCSATARRSAMPRRFSSGFSMAGWADYPRRYGFWLCLLLCRHLGAQRQRLRPPGAGAWQQRVGGKALRRAHGAVTVSVYVLSGLCSAIVGLMLAGFSDQAYYDMGKPYLLASIAAVVSAAQASPAAAVIISAFLAERSCLRRWEACCKPPHCPRQCEASSTAPFC